MKYLPKFATACLLLVSSCPPLSMATEDTTENDSQIKAHLESLETIYSVKAPSLELMNKALISFHAELLESDKGQRQLILDLEPEQAKDLQRLGFKVSENVEWKNRWLKKLQQQKALHTNQAAGIPGFPCYPTVGETFAKAISLAGQYSNIVEWNDIGDSWQRSENLGGYDLKVMKITNKAVTKQKPILFIHSAMHAREYATAALTLDYATHMLERYNEDADITWIINNHEIHILFHMNPDGRIEAQKGILWRKNTNTAYCGATSQSRGADLNRNFTFSWAETVNGSSGNECDATYRGPSPASEPETQAVEAYIKSLFPDSRGPGINDAAPLTTQGIHLDIHSFSELVLWPWGQTNSVAPNGAELETLGRKLAYWNGYTPIQSIGLYATDGTSDSVSYGELGIPNFTFELGTEFFQQCSVYENTILPDNLPALIYAAKVVQAPYQLPAGPDVYSVTLNGGTDVEIQTGAVVQVAGMASDSRSNNSGSFASPQNIQTVNYYYDTLPWAQDAVALTLNATDGAFNSFEEAFSGSLDTNSLANGRHFVYFQAVDSDGNKGAPYAAFVQVNNGANQPPAAAFAVDCNGATCSVDASTSTDDGLIENYQWDFGDVAAGAGNSATGLQSTHTYPSEQSFEITLTVTDKPGLTNTVTNNAVISAEPSANINVNCSELNCNFDGTSSSDLSGQIVNYQWDLGNGTTSSNSTGSVTYASAGNYTVVLTVTDDEGDTNSSQQAINVTMASPGGGSGGGGSFNIAILILLGCMARIRRKLKQ